MLFDFDGTLADSIDMVLSVINYYADKLHYRKIDINDIERLRRLGYKLALKEHGISWYKLPILVRLVRRDIKLRVSEIKPYEGITELLHSLNNQGYLIGVVTSNTIAVVSEFRARTSLPEIHIIGTSPAVFRKDRVLRKVIRSYDLDPEKVIYVGDEPRDIKAARKAGLRSIGVTWGLSDAGALKPERPNAIVTTVNQLEKNIHEMLDSNS